MKLNKNEIEEEVHNPCMKAHDMEIVFPTKSRINLYFKSLYCDCIIFICYYKSFDGIK